MKKLVILIFGLSFCLLQSFSQNVWVLNNGDPDYQNPPFDDSLKLYQSDGTKLMTKSGFNICQTLSGIRSIAVTNDGEYCWVSENVGDKLSKIDKYGNLIKEINKPIGGIDLSSNGNLYALGSNGTIHGDSIFVFDSSGNMLQSAPWGGYDLVVDEKHNSIWIVGSDIKKINLDLVHEFTIDPIAWSAMSVDFSTDGSVWVGEGEHPEVPGSQERILHISNDGSILDSISLQFSPNCVRVNRNDGNVWIASGYLYALDPSTLFIDQIANGGFSLGIDEQENIWIAGYSNVRKYSKSGNLLLTIDDFAGNDQKYIATTKHYNLSISETSLTSNNFIHIYPNPFSIKTTIEFTNPNHSNCKLSIFNISGNKVFEMENITSDKIEFERGDLPGGVYLIELKGEKVFRCKIVM